MTISRDHRDALHYEIRNYSLNCAGPMGDLELCVSTPGMGEQAPRLWAQIAGAARLLEQLGWDRAGDREVYELVVDRELVAWVRWWLEQSEGTLAEHAELITELRAGHDRRADFGPPPGGLAGELSDILAIADTELESIAACLSILDQLEPMVAS